MDSRSSNETIEGKRIKRKNEGINRRKDTLIKKAYKLGEFSGIDGTLIICKHGRYTTYRSRDHASWPATGYFRITQEKGRSCFEQLRTT